MSYVIMNSQYERLYRVKCEDKFYTSERGAKIVCTKLNKKDNGTWEVLSYAEFNEKHNPLVTVHNLMSGKPVQIRRSEVGRCTDPSTERYWSM